MTTSSSMMVTAPSARNDEVRMTNIRHSSRRLVTSAAAMVMMLMSGMKSAITIVPTTTARNTIMIGSSNRGERRDRIVHLVIVNFRDLQQHLGQLTGFFADVDHADDHRRKSAAGFERLHDRFAFLHAVVHLRNGVGDDGVAGGFAGDIQAPAKSERRW
jgi:hypothetical protein